MRNKFFLFFFCFINIFANAQIPDNKIYNLFLQKQYEKVIKAVEETDTLSATDFYYAGLSAEMFEDILLATFYFKKCVVVDSTFVPAKISLAQSLFQNEEFTDAIEIYVKLLETDTLNAFLWGGLGDCYAKLALMPLAYSCYQSAFYINPKNSANTLKLVSVLSALKTKNHFFN